MKFNKATLITNAISFGVLGLLSLVFGVSGVGAMAVVFGAVNILIGLILLITDKKDVAATCLLLGGLFLLTGFTLCSTFTFRLEAVMIYNTLQF